MPIQPQRGCGHPDAETRGCRNGGGIEEATTALRLAADGMKTQGSLASSATLGLEPESRWDSLHASEPVLPAGSFTCEVGLELETENLGLSFHCLVTSLATVGIWRLLPALVSYRGAQAWWMMARDWRTVARSSAPDGWPQRMATRSRAAGSAGSRDSG